LKLDDSNIIELLSGSQAIDIKPLLTIKWANSDWDYLSTFEYEDFEKRILTIGNYSASQKINGSTEINTITITLSDFDLYIKEKIKTETVVGTECILECLCYANDEKIRVPLTIGKISGAILWAESNYTFTFSIETAEPFGYIGYKTDVNDFENFLEAIEDIDWPTCVGTCIRVPARSIAKVEQIVNEYDATIETLNPIYYNTQYIYATVTGDYEAVPFNKNLEVTIGGYDFTVIFTEYYGYQILVEIIDNPLPSPGTVTATYLPFTSRDNADSGTWPGIFQPVNATPSTTEQDTTSFNDNNWGAPTKNKYSPRIGYIQKSNVPSWVLTSGAYAYVGIGPYHVVEIDSIEECNNSPTHWRVVLKERVIRSVTVDEQAATYGHTFVGATYVYRNRSPVSIKYIADKYYDVWPDGTSVPLMSGSHLNEWWYEFYYSGTRIIYTGEQWPSGGYYEEKSTTTIAHTESTVPRKYNPRIAWVSSLPAGITEDTYVYLSNAAYNKIESVQTIASGLVRLTFETPLFAYANYTVPLGVATILAGPSVSIIYYSSWYSSVYGKYIFNTYVYVNSYGFGVPLAGVIVSDTDINFEPPPNSDIVVIAGKKNWRYF
jgi:hypothetical protein